MKEGVVLADAPLAYAEGDPHAGTKPTITAAAYTNSVRAAPSTKLFNIDSGLDLLVLQDPPNDGALETVGPLGIDFDGAGGFDIVSDDKGRDSAFAASDSTLYAIDLETGKATRLGTIGRIKAARGSAVACPVEITRVEQEPCRSDGAARLAHLSGTRDAEERSAVAPATRYPGSGERSC